MLTVADRGEGGDKICQNLADVICERSLYKNRNWAINFVLMSKNKNV